REEARSHHPVAHPHARAPDEAGEDLLEVVALGHRQHVAAVVVHLLDVEAPALRLLELDAPLIQLLDHLEAAGGVRQDRPLIHDAVVGQRDLLDVVIDGGVPRDDGVVESIHADGDRAAALDVRLLEQQHPSYGPWNGPLPKLARALTHQMLTQSRSSRVLPAGSCTFRVALTKWRPTRSGPMVKPGRKLLAFEPNTRTSMPSPL